MWLTLDSNKLHRHCWLLEKNTSFLTTKWTNAARKSHLPIELDTFGGKIWQYLIFIGEDMTYLQASTGCKEKAKESQWLISSTIIKPFPSRYVNIFYRIRNSLGHNKYRPQRSLPISRGDKQVDHLLFNCPLVYIYFDYNKFLTAEFGKR